MTSIESLFFLPKKMSHLSNAKVWISDGTFKVVPKEFSQLYVIHGKIFNKDFPLAYILMKNRTEAMYSKVLSILKENNVKFPQYLIIDFEIQSFNAFKKASKETTIKFCLFHFGQCIWRRIQKEGFSKLYSRNIEFKMFIKCFLSLAFVPKEFVNHEFIKLKTKAKTFCEVNIDCFIIYFEKNFVNSSKYPVESWNAYERVIDGINLTSNSAEAFNCHFHNRFDQSHAGLQTFIEKLKETQSNTEQDIQFRMCNPDSVLSEKDHVLKMEKIKIICLNYEKYYDIYYLEAISTMYNWKLE